jgi:hypothetical protein
MFHSIQCSLPELGYRRFRVDHRASDVRPQSGGRDSQTTHFLGHVGNSGSGLEASLIVLDSELEDDFEELGRQMQEGFVL